MTINIFRYYGDCDVTKSRITVTLEGHTQPDMVCEGREARFVGYDTASLFPGWTLCSSPRGTHMARLRSTWQSPFTIAFGPSIHRLRTVIAWSTKHQVCQGRVLIGYANEEEEPELRTLINQQEAFRRLEELARIAFFSGERLKVVVA